MISTEYCGYALLKEIVSVVDVSNPSLWKKRTSLETDVEDSMSSNATLYCWF